MENNRTFLAIALIILVWTGYSIFFPAKSPMPDVSQPVVAVQATTGVTESAPRLQPAVAEVAAYPPQIVVPTVEKRVRVESDLYSFELTTSGARLRQAILKKYKQENKPDSAPIDIVRVDAGHLATFKTSGSEGLSLSADASYALLGDQAEYFLSGDEARVITFIANTPTGLEIQKSYTFHADSYQVDLNVKLINRSNQPARGLFDMSLINYWDDNRKGDSYNFVGPTSLVGENLENDDPKDLQTSSKTYGKDLVWSGFFTKYFVSIVSPQGDLTKKVHVERGDGYVENRFSSDLLSLAPSESIAFDYVVYLGPKDYDILQAVGHQFDSAIDLGFFSIIAQPLMVALKFFHGYLGNWGFAIVLLTVCIKALFWPLTQKSYSSMKAMQKLQPQMAKMREKYASDKQRLNQEMMALYKEKRVNPFGGCLPIVIQIPVFFALYQVLLRSIELRHAPFIFWLTDLSAKDPYYVTPLIMGVTMFLQQKMSPTTMEPMQAKMMMMMPVVFTFLFLNFPSGLVVYWLINNVLTIAQQYMINRKPA